MMYASGKLRHKGWGMKQLTLATTGFERYAKPTRRVSRRDGAGGAMVGAVPAIEPHYPKSGNGRPPVGVERMLCIHFLQH
jgi:hypothetical protein